MAEGNRSSGAIDLISNLAPLLLGSGKQTTSTSNTASKQGLDPKTTAMLQSLISGKEYSKGAAVSDTQGAMENAMKLMMQSGMPDISNALHAQGAYNSSTNNLLTNDLMSRAAGAGAQIQLDQINKYSDTRANAAATLKDANTTTTTAQKSTAKTAPVVSPWLTGGAMLGGTLLSHLLDGFGSSNKKRPGDSNMQDSSYAAPMHFDTNGGGGLSSMLQGAFSSPESGMGGITRAIEGAFSNFGGSGKSGGSSSSGFSGGTGLLGGLLSGLFGSGGGSSIAAPNAGFASDSGAPGGSNSQTGSTFGLGDIGNFFSNLFKF
jgi:hypothetical protein